MTSEKSYKKNKILFFLIITFFSFEIISFFIAGHFLTANEWGNIDASMVKFFITTPLALITAILSIIGLIKLKHILKTFCLIILFLSLVIALPNSTLMSESFFRSFYKPLRTIHYKITIKKLEETKSNHYVFFKKGLSSKRTVTSVSCGGVITLDNNIKVTINDVYNGVQRYPRNKWDEIRNEIRNRMKEKLVGKKINIITPTKEDFFNKYIPRSANGCYYYDHNTWPKQNGVSLGELEVDAMINNELIDFDWLELIK